jgi:hypothetical protein
MTNLKKCSACGNVKYLTAGGYYKCYGHYELYGMSGEDEDPDDKPAFDESGDFIFEIEHPA